MKFAVSDVYNFHKAFEVPILFAPQNPGELRKQLRMKLLTEEFMELSVAFHDNNIPEIADGLVDLIYVAIGTALEYGIPLAQIWTEVHRANMAKLGPDGRPIYRADGKVMKPGNWQPPHIRAILLRAGWRG